MSASRLRPLRKGSDHVADLRIKVLGARYFAYWRAKPNVHTIQAVCEYISLELWIPGLPCACLRVFGLRCRGRMSPKGGGGRNFVAFCPEMLLSECRVAQGA